MRAGQKLAVAGDGAAERALPGRHALAALVDGQLHQLGRVHGGEAGFPGLIVTSTWTLLYADRAACDKSLGRRQPAPRIAAVGEANVRNFGGDCRVKSSGGPAARPRLGVVGSGQ